MANFRQRPESYTCHSGVSLGDEMVITVITRRRALLQRLGLLVHRRHRVIFTAAGACGRYYMSAASESMFPWCDVAHFRWRTWHGATR